LGDEGADVQLLQEALESLGYTEVGTPDGRYSETTQQAMVRFQSENNLFGDGRFGPDSQVALHTATFYAGTQEHFGELFATSLAGDAAAPPDGHEPAWDQAWAGDQAQAWAGEPDPSVPAWTEGQEQAWQPTGGEGPTGVDSLALGADTLYAAPAKTPGRSTQRSSTPEVFFRRDPVVNGSQMELKLRNEGTTSIEPMTHVGSYTIEDAGGNVVHGPVSIENITEVEWGKAFEVSHDIENIPGPMDALRDGDYTATITLVTKVSKTLKFKKEMGKVKPR
jgi:peptidoglycan hydrolase-like protein with peptidoglycan-binding domain